MRASHLFVFIMLAIALAMSPARAGECFGMLSYTYDGGECTDTTGDTTEILIHAGNEAESLQRGMTDRSRLSHIGESATRARRPQVDPRLARTVGMRLLVKYSGPTILPPLLGKQIGKSAKQRKFLESAFDYELYTYDADPAASAYISPHWLPGARTYFTEVMYQIYDGERIDQPTRSLLDSAWTSNMMRTTITAQSEASKEVLREKYVLRAALAFDEAKYLLKKHEAAKFNAFRAVARKALIADLNVDPATVRLADLVCIAYPLHQIGLRNITCAEERQLLETGHF